MKLKSEKSIKSFLEKLPDDDIIKYYLDVEFTPFPVLIIEEYNRRFKRKTKEQIIRDLKYQARLARIKASRLHSFARRHRLVDDVTKQKSQEIVRQAKKKGFEFSQQISKKGVPLGSKLKKGTRSSLQKGITAGKKLKKSKQKQLELLEKLGQLKKAGIITHKEFTVKKKKILEKI